MNGNTPGADRAAYSSYGYDPDDSLRQLYDDEQAILHSIPPGLTQWASRLHPLLPSVPLAETDAAKAFEAMSQLLANGAAQLFATARGSTSTLIDYDVIWALDEKYGTGTTEALAREILRRGVGEGHSYPISVRTFVWNHLAEQLLNPTSPALQ
jgi:hypothetical protein